MYLPHENGKYEVTNVSAPGLVSYQVSVEHCGLEVAWASGIDLCEPTLHLLAG